MADLTFEQELVKAGVSAAGVVLAGGLSVLLGWRLLRRQERIKREEEHVAALWKRRADALVKTAKALSRYQNLKVRRLQFEADPSIAREHVQMFKDHEGRAAQDFVDTVSHEQFLLGQFADEVSKSWKEMVKTDSSIEIGRAAHRLHAEFEKWIPPLKPMPLAPSWKAWPWIVSCAALVLGAPLLHLASPGRPGFLMGEGLAVLAVLVGLEGMRRALAALRAGGRVRFGSDDRATAAPEGEGS